MINGRFMKWLKTRAENKFDSEHHLSIVCLLGTVWVIRDYTIYIYTIEWWSYPCKSVRMLHSEHPVYVIGRLDEPRINVRDIRCQRRWWHVVVVVVSPPLYANQRRDIALSSTTERLPVWRLFRQTKEGNPTAVAEKGYFRK